jgi:UDP-glucose 4-epimerase
MNAFVTGGAGYIGSEVTRELLRAGHRVTVFDSLLTGHRSAIPREARFLHADLADRTALESALASEPYDAILHFASLIEAGESMVSPGKYFHNNASLSFDLIDAAARAGVRRFVLSSSAAVYASSDEPLTEESPLGPANVYGQTKRMIEEALEWHRRISGLHFAALRYFNAAGATPEHGEDHQPESHLIPLVLRVALGKLPEARIFGTDYPTPDGTCIRDYIHIRDLVSAHLLALDALETRDRLTYNLGNGVGYAVRQVIESARRITGHPIPAVETQRRAGDAARLVAASEKIRRELGWKPLHPDLDEIVSSAWSWHRSHPSGYQDL